MAPSPHQMDLCGLRSSDSLVPVSSLAFRRLSPAALPPPTAYGSRLGRLGRDDSGSSINQRHPSGAGGMSLGGSQPTGGSQSGVGGGGQPGGGLNRLAIHAGIGTRAGDYAAGVLVPVSSWVRAWFAFLSGSVTMRRTARTWFVGIPNEPRAMSLLVRVGEFRCEPFQRRDLGR